MFFDYLVLHANADASENLLDAEQIRIRRKQHSIDPSCGMIVKYPGQLVPPEMGTYYSNGLTRFRYSVDDVARESYNALRACRKFIEGRIGLYLPAPRARFEFEAACWTSRIWANAGVDFVIFDAQLDDDGEAGADEYDKVVCRQFSDSLRRTHNKKWPHSFVYTEPCDATMPCAQECSPLLPGQGLERGIARRFSSVDAFEVIALITDAASTAADSIAYANRWADAGHAVAWNMQGWSKRHNIRVVGGKIVEATNV